ncbi:SDR family oxidoreductase [uncultured Abyssibacter sp.]|uniref:NAD-dependent epimerase/dehydratase family protein n=1 Tax=uncultured Abyssibacter sp. TaxID=2320202 RepID=UPI0032B2E197
MRILVIGNMGYVGPVLCEHLRRTRPDATLIGYDSGLFGHCLTTDHFPERVLDTQHFGDARNLSAALFENIDAVVYLAAVSNDPMGRDFAKPTGEINHEAAVHCAGLAAEAGVSHFVFASSCSVYGYAEDARARAEGDPIDPLTAYARSKIAAEHGLAALADSGMTISCLRFATACGMSPRLRLDLVLNDFVAGAVASGQITVLSDGTPWRPLIHVRDMARAIDWAVDRPTEAGGASLVVNVGSDSWNLQVADLAHAVAGVIDGTTVSIATDAPPDKRSYRVDFSLFQSLAPDHQPLETLDSTIQGLREGLAAIGFNDPAFRESLLMRLRALRALIDAGRLSPDLRWTDHAD